VTPLAHMTTLLAVTAPLALGGCSDTNTTLQGYVEGTYIYVSAQSSGRLTEVSVRRGDTIEKGTLIARLDATEEEQAVANGEARLAQAKAQLADLRSGKRAEEIEVIEARLAEAQAARDLAETEYRRQLALHERRVVAQSVADNARTQRDQAEANVRALASELAVARLPARPDEIAAAEMNVAAEEAALMQARIHLERRQLHAPTSGSVEETFYEAGEFVNAGQAVVSLLPEGNRKIRFFLPQAQLAGIQLGDRITVACDGCASGLEARIDRIATEAEFTPPVLYSRDSREKLVFLVEAQPLGAATALKVGQPVDVMLSPASEGG